jgi:hypothetical protein
MCLKTGADDEALYELSLASCEEHFELREAFGVAEGEVQRVLETRSRVSAWIWRETRIRLLSGLPDGVRQGHAE